MYIVDDQAIVTIANLTEMAVYETTRGRDPSGRTRSCRHDCSGLGGNTGAGTTAREHHHPIRVRKAKRFQPKKRGDRTSDCVAVTTEARSGPVEPSTLTHNSATLIGAGRCRTLDEESRQQIDGGCAAERVRHYCHTVTINVPRCANRRAELIEQRDYL
jgi:hypothetical protein